MNQLLEHLNVFTDWISFSLSYRLVSGQPDVCLQRNNDILAEDDFFIPPTLKQSKTRDPRKPGSRKSTKKIFEKKKTLKIQL